MSIDESKGASASINNEAYYEAVASQEEIYLETVEEELRAILIFCAPFPLRKEVTRVMFDENNDPGIADSLEKQLNHAA